jgi:hypothetical protein
MAEHASCDSSQSAPARTCFERHGAGIRRLAAVGDPRLPRTPVGAIAALARFVPWDSAEVWMAGIGGNRAELTGMVVLAPYVYQSRRTIVITPTPAEIERAFSGADALLVACGAFTADEARAQRVFPATSVLRDESSPVGPETELLIVSSTNFDWWGHESLRADLVIVHDSAAKHPWVFASCAVFQLDGARTLHVTATTEPEAETETARAARNFGSTGL